MRSSIPACAADNPMPRKISWALLGISAVLISWWYFQTQWSYRAFVQVARGITLQLADSVLEETQERVLVRFTLLIKNTSERAIPFEGASCLLYAGQEFLGPCAISADAALISPHGEWRLEVITELSGHYLENYRKAQADGVRVQGTVQLELPVGSDSIKVTRRFHELIPKQ